MGWDPNLIFYACVAKGPTVLAEYTSSSSSSPSPAGAGTESDGIEAVARRCLERTPPHHSTFSHTVRNKSYTFLIDDPFAYFVISHENLGVNEVRRFLDRVKKAFRVGVVGVEGVGEVSDLCLDGKMCPLFMEVLELDVVNGSDRGQEKGDWCSAAREEKEGSAAGKPLLVKPSKFLMKKKRVFGSGSGGGGGREVNGDHHVKDGVVGGDDLVDGANKGLNNVGENGNVVLSRELSVTMVQKGGGVGSGVYHGEGRQKAKQIWRKHVWVVLVLDLVVCAVLFGLWLGVCRGFKCIDG